MLWCYTGTYTLDYNDIGSYLQPSGTIVGHPWADQCRTVQCLCWCTVVYWCTGVHWCHHYRLQCTGMPCAEELSCGVDNPLGCYCGYIPVMQIWKPKDNFEEFLLLMQKAVICCGYIPNLLEWLIFRHGTGCIFNSNIKRSDIHPALYLVFDQSNMIFQTTSSIDTLYSGITTQFFLQTSW